MEHNDIDKLQQKEWLLEMPLEDPTSWDLSKEEQLEPHMVVEQTKLSKSGRSRKKRKKTKPDAKPPSATEVMKNSYKEMELRAPSSDIRKRLRLLNTEVKSYFFKKQVRLSLKLEHLSKEGTKPATVYIRPNGDMRVSALTLPAVSAHETSSGLFELINEAIEDESSSKKRQEKRKEKKKERSKHRRRRERKSRSPTRATGRKSRSPTHRSSAERKPRSPPPTERTSRSPARTEKRMRSPTRTKRRSPSASRVTGNTSPRIVVSIGTERGYSSDSSCSFRRLIQEIDYEHDIDKQELAKRLVFPNDAKRAIERDALGGSERRLRAADSAMSLHGSQLLMEAASLQARIHQLRHVNAAA